MSDEIILNFDDSKVRTMVSQWIKALRGTHRVRIRKAYKGRSLPQNAYLWGVVYPCLCKGLSEAWGEDMTVEEVHELMRSKFNTVLIVNRNTGEIKGTRPRTTTTLDTKEFGVYIDNCIRFGAEFLNVEIPACK